MRHGDGLLLATAVMELQRAAHLARHEKNPRTAVKREARAIARELSMVNRARFAAHVERALARLAK